MSGPHDQTAQNYGAMYSRWMELRAHQDPSRPPSEEFTMLTQILQKFAAARRASGAAPNFAHNMPHHLSQNATMSPMNGLDPLRMPNPGQPPLNAPMSPRMMAKKPMAMNNTAQNPVNRPQSTQMPPGMPSPASQGPVNPSRLLNPNVGNPNARLPPRSMAMPLPQSHMSPRMNSMPGIMPPPGANGPMGSGPGGTGPISSAMNPGPMNPGPMNPGPMNPGPMNPGPMNSMMNSMMNGPISSGPMPNGMPSGSMPSGSMPSGSMPSGMPNGPMPNGPNTNASNPHSPAMHTSRNPRRPVSVASQTYATRPPDLEKIAKPPPPEPDSKGSSKSDEWLAFDNLGNNLFGPGDHTSDTMYQDVFKEDSSHGLIDVFGNMSMPSKPSAGPATNLDASDALSNPMPGGTNMGSSGMPSYRPSDLDPNSAHPPPAQPAGSPRMMLNRPFPTGGYAGPVAAEPLRTNPKSNSVPFPNPSPASLHNPSLGTALPPPPGSALPNADPSRGGSLSATCEPSAKTKATRTGKPRAKGRTPAAAEMAVKDPDASASDLPQNEDQHLFNADSTQVLTNQDLGFQALSNHQPVSDSIRQVLFSAHGPAAKLPNWSQLRARSKSGSIRTAGETSAGFTNQNPGTAPPKVPPMGGENRASGSISPRDASKQLPPPFHPNMVPNEPHFAAPIQQMPIIPPASQPKPLAAPTGPEPAANRPPAPTRLPLPAGGVGTGDMGSAGGAVSSLGSDAQQEHIGQQRQMDEELSLKRMKQQQWQAKQHQEEMFQQRHTPSDFNDVAFVVPGGPNLNTAGPSRRLASAADAASGDLPRDLSMRAFLGFDRVVNPESLLPRAIKFEDLPKHEQQLTVPSLMPVGVSLQDMRNLRRECITYEKLERAKELEQKKLAKIAASSALPPGKTVPGKTVLGKMPQLDIDEEIELFRLKLEPYVLATRGELITHMQYFNSVSIDRSNRVHFARMKPLTQHNAALVERFAQEQAMERRKAENRGQYLRLQRIHAHASKLSTFHDKKRQQKFTFKASIGDYHSNVEREERKRYERTARQRLQLLRANDEDAYLKLLHETKDARITHLLKQANKYMVGLAKAVKYQQNEVKGNPPGVESTAEPAPEEIEEEEDGGEETDEEGDVRETFDYYEVVHRVKETITEQPSILVGGKLKDYQIKGLQWMVSLYNNKLNGILADEMGLGKTIQSISLIAYLIEKKKVNGPFLFLVPLSTISNWNMEFDVWAPSISKVVYRGTPMVRKALQPRVRAGDFQVLLTTYEYVIKERPLFSRIKWEHMIIDEGHRMKNAQSKLSSTLAQYYTSRYRLILTGTPLQNNLPELWALLNFVLPKIFSSVKSFEDWFNKPFAQAGASDRMSLDEEEKLLIIRRLHKVLRPFLLRRLKKDVEQDLPDKVEHIIKCKKSALQSQLYRQLLDPHGLPLGAISGIRSLSNRVMQLRKLCNHPFVFEEVEKFVNPGGLNNNLLWRTAGKFELLDRILPKFIATGHRTLMFFQMTQIMDIMEDFLRLRGIKYLRLDGATRTDVRGDLLRMFNAPDSEYFCFLLSTRAGGLGLNLQSADTVIIYDTDWNPHQDLQAQDRAHRIGQTKEVRILRLITENSIEENILERAHGKLDIDGKVIQAGKFDNKSTNEEQEAFLRTLLEAEESKTDGKEEDELEEIDDDEINSMLARSEEERELFHQMDLDRIKDDAEKSNSPRLFSEAELPVQYTTAHINQKLTEAAAKEYVQTDEGGHHLRTRKIDRWVDFEEDFPPRKRSRGNGTDDNEFSPPIGLPVAAIQASAPPSLPKPRIGRKGRPPKVKETLTIEARAQLTEVGRRIIKRMKEITDEHGRTRIDLFLELPSRNTYPDYYKLITLPMCVTTILKRLNAKYYQSFKQYGNDWRIIFRNARWYNAEGSTVYNDANELERAFEETFEQYVGMPPPAYVDVVGDQPEKLNLQRGLPTPGTVDTSVGAEIVASARERSSERVGAEPSSFSQPV